MTNPTIHVGDCLDTLRAMPDASVSAVVTDPPYGLGKPPPIRDLLRAWLADEDHDHLAGAGGFMGAAWDAIVPHPRIWAECHRVLKPGGHIIAFAGQRTTDLMGVALRLGGFTIRDLGAWAYWSGFPKSLDVSKAIDRRRHDADQSAMVCRWIAGTAKERGVTRRMVDDAFGSTNICQQWFTYWTDRPVGPRVPTLEQVPLLLEVLGSPPVPEEIRRLLMDLNGRKGEPGAAWFDREVVGAGYRVDRADGATPIARPSSGHYDITAPATPDAIRWQGWGIALKPCLEPWILARKPFPGTVAANVLQHGTGALNIDACRYPYGDPAWPGPSDRDSAEAKHASVEGIDSPRNATAYSDHNAPRANGFNPGGRWPANVYYCPKASRAEREAGCEHLARARWDASRDPDAPGANNPRNRGGSERGNNHPTVKPIALMRWLVRMVAPPGGLILDPFAGSGTTLIAATLEGFGSVGCELSPDHAAIARARVDHWRTLDPSEPRPESADRQVRLF